MLDHVVDREQAPHQCFRLRDPAVAALQRMRAFLKVDGHGRRHPLLGLRASSLCGAGGLAGGQSQSRDAFSHTEAPRQRGRSCGESTQPREKKRRNDRRTSSTFSVPRTPIRLAMSEECIVNSLVAFTIDGLGSPPAAKSPLQTHTAFGSSVM